MKYKPDHSVPIPEIVIDHVLLKIMYNTTGLAPYCRYCTVLFVLNCTRGSIPEVLQVFYCTNGWLSCYSTSYVMNFRYCSVLKGNLYYIFLMLYLTIVESYISCCRSYTVLQVLHCTSFTKLYRKFCTGSTTGILLK